MSEQKPSKSINIGGDLHGDFVDGHQGDVVSGDKDARTIAQNIEGNLETESNEVTQNVGMLSPFDDARAACGDDERAKGLITDLETLANSKEEKEPNVFSETVKGIASQLKSTLKDNGPKVAELTVKAAKLLPPPANVIATLVGDVFGIA